jgi:ATP synthase protein I
MTVDTPPQPRSPSTAAVEPWDAATENEEPPVTPWTREQVQALEAGQPPVSMWTVVGVQALVGALVVLAWWVLGNAPFAQAKSAAWGAAAVVLPHAVMAWGLRRSAAGANAAWLGFLMWELVKVGLVVAILLVAAKSVPDLSWPALLVALIGCLKVHLGALLFGARQRNGRQQEASAR